MDEWTKEQVEVSRKPIIQFAYPNEFLQTMRSIGNVKSNAIFNPNEIRNPPPPNLEDSERDSEIELYIRGENQFAY